MFFEQIKAEYFATVSQLFVFHSTLDIFHLFPVT